MNLTLIRGKFKGEQNTRKYGTLYVYNNIIQALNALFQRLCTLQTTKLDYVCQAKSFFGNKK